MKLPRLVLLVGLLAVGLGAASQPAAADNDKARASFDRGTRYYNLNRFEDALKEYEAAYLELPDAVFLFNIGQCYRQMGKLELAVKTYRTYLRTKPNAPNAADVKRRIEELENELRAPPAPAAAARANPPAPAAAARANPPVATDPPPPLPQVSPPPVEENQSVPIVETPARSVDGSSDDQPLYTRWWFWGGVGAVVVGAIVIGVLASGSGGKEPCPEGITCL